MFRDYNFKATSKTDSVNKKTYVCDSQSNIFKRKYWYRFIVEVAKVTREGKMIKEKVTRANGGCLGF